MKKFFVFQKNCFKVKVLKTFRISSDFHIKTCQSLKRRAILKIPSTVFIRTYALSVGFKMKPLRKSVFLCKTKTISIFAVNFVQMLKEATIHFCLFDESYVAMESIEIYWLCKYNKEVRRSQLLSQGNLILNCRKGEKKGFSAFIKKTLFYGQCFED